MKTSQNRVQPVTSSDAASPVVSLGRSNNSRAIGSHRAYLTCDTLWVLHHKWFTGAGVHTSLVWVAPMGTKAHILTVLVLIYALPTKLHRK